MCIPEMKAIEKLKLVPIAWAHQIIPYNWQPSEHLWGSHYYHISKRWCFWQNLITISARSWLLLHTSRCNPFTRPYLSIFVVNQLLYFQSACHSWKPLHAYHQKYQCTVSPPTGLYPWCRQTFVVFIFHLRLLEGIGTAMLMTVSYTLLTKFYPEESKWLLTTKSSAFFLPDIGRRQYL